MNTGYLITRHEILAMSKVSRSHALKIIIDPTKKFPKPVKHIGKKLFYVRKTVIAWLNKNDMSKISYFSKKPVEDFPKNQNKPGLDNKMALNFICQKRSYYD